MEPNSSVLSGLKRKRCEALGAFRTCEAQIVQARTRPRAERCASRS